MPVKVLFINAVDPREEIENRYPPLGIGYLISALRNRFGDELFRFKVVSAGVKGELKRFNPDIVGITCVTQNYNIAKGHAKAAKSFGIPVIIGGIHISALPSSLT
ncbi:MAG: cobalamin-dependent protein, partial [Candidatus Omnitrophota bacterium]